MTLLKSLPIQFLYLFVITVFLIGCDDSEERIPSLSFVENTIPTDELSADGGSITIEVDWANTRWSVSTDEVIAGSEFITGITPAYAGSDNGAAKTQVKITYKANSSPTSNQQKLTLKSLTGTLSQSVTLSQSAKIIVPTHVTITSGTTYQTIAGFGGANTMWGTDFLTASQLKSAFGTGDDELGMSIFRVRLSPVPTDWPALVATLKEAKKYDVKIIASPWSPPANLKSNSNLVGGHLLEANYAAYATHLNDFVQYMASEDVTIDVVSIQNEPDIQVGYESCDWTSPQMLNFLKNHASSITGTKIAAAESFNFKQSFTNPFLEDADVVNKFDIVAGHIYGAGQASYPLAEQKGKEVWMTEYLMNLNTGNQGAPAWTTYNEAAKWDETMQMLGTVHTAMANRWNAYIWWYIRRYYSFLGDGEQGTTLGTILKRGYAFSHFSKFVRPGYVRIDASATALNGLNVTAYSGDGKIVAVIINPTENPVYDVNLSVPNTISSAVAYTTSLTLNRQMEALAPESNAVELTMEPKSITTVVMSF